MTSTAAPLALMAAYVAHEVSPYIPGGTVAVAAVKALPVALMGASLASPLSQPRLLLRFGLLLSACGDFALDLDDRHFISGLLCFAAAHITYTASFLSSSLKAAPPSSSAPPSFASLLARLAPVAALVALPMGPVALRLLPAVGAAQPELLAPVAVYMALIFAMVVSSWAPYLTLPPSSSSSSSSTMSQPSSSAAAAAAAYSAAAGAALFAVSDTILAFNRFSSPFPGAKLAVMLTYYAAQTCIAASAPASGVGSLSPSSSSLAVAAERVGGESPAGGKKRK